jgi:tRNA G10  N-methylase Trm11
VKTIHPFPARMAPSIVLQKLDDVAPGAIILDPMSGSGTTCVAARSRKLRAWGCDTDPLALIIARANTQDLNVVGLETAGEAVLKSARRRAARLKPCNAYPASADSETVDFIDYWFDKQARIELEALSRSINDVGPKYQDFLRCSFSRMIITKKHGVSLAEDVSHSRPHKTRDVAPVRPLDIFHQCVRAVVRSSNFADAPGLPPAAIVEADCRRLPYDRSSVDHIVTSPPYLNAIDYLRGHKMSLVWLGHTIGDLRKLRKANIGTEVGSRSDSNDAVVRDMVTWFEQPTSRLLNRLRQYVHDLDQAISEMKRVLKPGGTLTMVVGDCTIKSCDVRNSVAIDLLAQRHNFVLVERAVRELSPMHRYLPPPKTAMAHLAKRMSEELVLTYRGV